MDRVRRRLSYATWRAVVDGNGWSTYHLGDGRVISGDLDRKIVAILNGQSLDDYATDYPASIGTATSEEDAFALIDDAAAVPPIIRTSDGKPVSLINRFPGNVTLYLAGADDDIAGGVRGAGAQFELTGDDGAPNGNVEREIQFLDWYYLAGGEVTYCAGGPGCWISLHLRMPATTVVANAGAGAVDLVDTGNGYNAIVPNGSTTGSHDLGSTVTPVPNESGTGWWDWDGPDTGLGTVTPNATGTGAFDLVDVQLDPVRFANRIPLRADGLGLVKDLRVNEIKPKKILPQWKLVVTLHKAAGTNALVVDWELVTARRVTA